MAKNEPFSRKVGQKIERADDRPRDERAGDEPEPRGEPPAEVQPRGHVGAHGEEDAVAERELAAEAGDDVPGDREAGEEIRVDEDVQPEAVAGEDRERQDGEREPADEQQHRPVERGNAARALQVVPPAPPRSACSRKPISSAPTWPKSPVGRTTSTARKTRNQIALLELRIDVVAGERLHDADDHPAEVRAGDAAEPAEHHDRERREDEVAAIWATACRSARSGRRPARRAPRRCRGHHERALDVDAHQPRGLAVLRHRADRLAGSVRCRKKCSATAITVTAIRIMRRVAAIWMSPSSSRAPPPSSARCSPRRA